MKKIIVLFFLSALLFSCGVKKNKVEILKNYNQIYLDANSTKVPVEPTNKTKELDFKAKLSSILLDLHKMSPDKKIYFPIGYRLYIGKSGKVEKIMIKDRYSKGYVMGMISSTPELKEENIFSDSKLLTTKLIPIFESLEFKPGKLHGKIVPFRIDLDAIGSVNKEEKVKLKLTRKSEIDFNFESIGEINDNYFVAVEQMPSPIGGLQGIQEKIVYPEIAKRAGVQGRVFIKAYINEKGDVDKAEVIKGIGAGCDEAAIKAVKETKFVPGMQRGKPVKVQVAIPILFKLDGAENSSHIHFLLKRAKNEKKSETATITGRVFNSEKNKSILGANIILKNTKIGAATDENGNYLITNIQPGQYNLIFTKYPYDKSESKKFTFKPGFKYVIDIIVKK